MESCPPSRGIRIYEIEREVKELALDQRQAIRQQQTKPLLDALHQWMVLQRQKVPEGSASAKALDYSLRRWGALTRFVGDGQLPVDNNWIENQIRPIAIGRNKANSTFMRSRHDAVESAPWAGSPQGTDIASHNHSACKNANKALGARYRACLISGFFSRASARSFMARSASTYM